MTLTVNGSGSSNDSSRSSPNIATQRKGTQKGSGGMYVPRRHDELAAAGTGGGAAATHTTGSSNGTSTDMNGTGYNDKYGGAGDTAATTSVRPGMMGAMGESVRSLASRISSTMGGEGVVGYGASPGGLLSGDLTFRVTAKDLAALANERTRPALAQVLEIYLDEENRARPITGVVTRPPDEATGQINLGESEPIDGTVELTGMKSRSNKNLQEQAPPGTIISNGGGPLDPLPPKKDRDQTTSTFVITPEGEEYDPEAPNDRAKTYCFLRNLVQQIRTHEESAAADVDLADEERADEAAETAAAALTKYVLLSSPERGIDANAATSLFNNVEKRKEVFGMNAIADKKLDSFLKLCWEAVQDFVLIMLICLGVVSIVIETTIGLEPGESCGVCWIEGAAILVAVLIVVLVTAGIDYKKQYTFVRLSETLDRTNTKSVVRCGEQVSVVDADIVVGDILSVNAHSLASIPADCVLLGPCTGANLKVDESSLTGESKLVTKRPGDVVLSGTTVVQNSGRMVVIAVGVNSVAGKIKARVYESASEREGDDGEGEEALEGDDETPLFAKLTLLAKQIGLAGTAAAVVAFTASCIIGLGFHGAPASMLVDYFIVAVTVLAVAVPEGLPLAVTLALAFSSNRMTKDQNLVKHLDACETMGCATTICTDKTGTLTANKMTARAMRIGDRNFVCTNPAQTLGDMVQESADRPPEEALQTVANLVSIATMDESVLHLSDKDGGKTVEGSSGNPTECALLVLVHDLGFDYRNIRNTTRGRSDVGDLAKHLGDGKQFPFSSARKMMSWAVPLEDGDGFRIYSKGAADVILSRCTMRMVNGKAEDLVDETRGDVSDTVEIYARRGMRCLALAYRDLPSDVVWDQKSDQVTNSNGDGANEVETKLTFAALVGIEDPLRKEVPGAIDRCYEAGIDVRMVTGDAPNTAVSIAHQAGILRVEHFVHSEDDVHEETEWVASNLKENVLMEGKVFREKVYRVGDDGKKEFDQHSFDKIWPFLRVLARSSPDDKLTLAHGLNQSTLFTDKEKCKKLRDEDKVKIFPDRQVIAMTGDGTNDAPALKRADIGFAMGIAGTQIAKDAADIILLDDNFASIVTAAKWGRNVYASIQKFLQFQLTVNISAVTTALVGAFAYQRSPLAAIQLLWVNLLMDSLASLALASEPPKDDLLTKPPVNRTEHLITRRMWANMLGQASYQIIVVMVLLFEGPRIFDIFPGHCVETKGCPYPDSPKENSVHYTIIFNAFVWMQLFNEINCRNLKGEFCVFRGIEKNPLFCGIWLITAVLQVIMVQFGSYAMHVAEGGLDAEYWGICMAFGIASFPVQVIINVIFRNCQYYKIWRQRRKLRKNRQNYHENISDRHYRA